MKQFSDTILLTRHVTYDNDTYQATFDAEFEDGSVTIEQITPLHNITQETSKFRFRFYNEVSECSEDLEFPNFEDALNYLYDCIM